MIVRVGFVVWNDRIAPVFDAARHIHVVDAESGRVISETQATLPTDSPAGKAIRLAELGIRDLVCGAISYPLRAIVTSYGIRVIPFIAGQLDIIVRAWLTDTLDHDVYAMPGCCGGHRRGVRGGAPSQGGRNQVQARSRRGGGPGGGRGCGRMGGPFAAGPAGNCICPQCGYREPHQRGIPCNFSQCPGCGVALTRG